MNEIRDLRRDDRIILWQYRGLNVQDGHAGVVIREVDREDYLNNRRNWNEA